mmetsp:Transcript_20810/g.31776  ORF Transcript_20810/g.31776 Transcript_20810/m.31776 type:complete len:128 (+) Transcript_20810:22-405(+)
MAVPTDKSWQTVRKGNTEAKVITNFGSRSFSFSEGTGAISLAPSDSAETKSENSHSPPTSIIEEHTLTSEVTEGNDDTISESDEYSEFSKQEESKTETSQTEKDPDEGTSAEARIIVEKKKKKIKRQ